MKYSMINSVILAIYTACDILVLLYYLRKGKIFSSKINIIITTVLFSIVLVEQTVLSIIHSSNFDDNFLQVFGCYIVILICYLAIIALSLIIKSYQVVLQKIDDAIEESTTISEQENDG